MPASTRLQQAASATSTSLSSASSALASVVLSLPSRYSDYVTSNASAVSTIESSVRSLTYLLPGARLHDSELASESVYTLVALLSIYHDSLLKKSASLITASSPLRRDLKALLPKPSLHAKYTSFWTNASSLYTQVATVLRVTEYIQLLCEMVAKRRGGERSRWRAVVLLEAVKALCRLLLLQLTGWRPLSSPPLPQREDFAPQLVDPDLDQDFCEDELKMASESDEFNSKSAFADSGVPTPPLSESEKIPAAANPAEPFNMPRTGITLPTLPSPDTISSYLLSRVLTADDVKPAKQLLHRLTTMQGQASEVIYILRPLVYAVLMQRLARTYGYEGSKWKKAWSPWLVGIALEYLSRQLYKRDLIARTASPRLAGATALEKDELKKRGWNLAWWGLRGAFYENITKRYVVGVSDRLKGKPLLDLIGVIVEDYDYLWSSYYFSTSTV